MHKHNAVRAFFAVLAFMLAGAAPAASQHVVEYRWGTGAVLGQPVKAGSKVTVRLTGLNPLCYDYTLNARPRLAPVDLQQLSELLTTPGGKATVDSAAIKSGRTLGGVPAGDGVLKGLGIAPGMRIRIQDVRQETHDAVAAVNVLREDFTTAEAVVRLAEAPDCNGTTSLSGALGEWASAIIGDPLRDAVQRISTARAVVATAQVNVASVLQDAKTPAEKSPLTGYAGFLTAAAAALDSLDAARPRLVQRMIRARAIMSSAESDGSEDTTEVYVPQGSDSLYLVATRRDLHVEAGKTAAVATQTAQLPVRNGMRFFVSAGAMASGLNARDYQRVNRAYADTSNGVYSTFANVSRGNALAFSPVVQGNVGFPEIRGTGVSFLGSTGIAVRSVNGSNSPEFLVGVGLSFLDRMVLTVGGHLGRRERLLIGEASAVEAAPVPESVNEPSAIGVEWKVAPVVTFSIRVN